jgi:ligand-binding sensor domain-containing protein
MSGHIRQTRALQKLLSVCALLMALAAASAEHLPIRFYTTADGLPSNSVFCLVRDSRGFMWFCTSEGLSRYDGYGFTNYGIDQGLPDAGVIHFLETRDGEYWVATASGISRFLPQIPSARDQAGGKSRRFFDVYRLEQNEFWSRRPLQLAEAPDGRIWCLTTDGLFRFDRTRKQFESIETGAYGYTSLFQERDGSLWLGGVAVLFHRLPDGRKEHYHKAEGLPVSRDGLVGVQAILRDRDEQLWLQRRMGCAGCPRTRHRGRRQWSGCIPGSRALLMMWWLACFNPMTGQSGWQRNTV